MFKILKKQIYRTQFMIYASLLFLACLLVGFGLAQNIIKRQVDGFYDDAQQSFQSVESTISSNINRIDNYFLDLYSSKNKGILADYMRLFGNDAETYVMRRLTELPASIENNDCIEHISQFVNTSKNAVSQVTLTLFDKPKESTVIHLRTPTIPTVEFKVDNQTIDRMSKGYTYTKLVMDPDNMSKELGKMEFLIDKGPIYYALSSTNSEKAKSALFGADLAIYPSDTSEKEKTRFEEMYHSGKHSGTIGNGLSDRQHYIIFTSEQNRYRLVTAIPESAIMEENTLFLIIVYGGMLFIFVLCLGLILVRMSYDAKNLQKIVKVIDQTKVGNFTTIDSSKMKDEYKIIAKELNDMAEQLDLYIKEKYIIKLKQEKAERKMLQQQISPHFLYNTLEIIRSRALVEGNENIANVVCDLGNLFRSIIKGEDIITIEEELSLLQKYINIMEFKYPGKFFYQIDIPQSVREMQTVKFWIQPIVENYFIHGFRLDNEFNLLIVRAHYAEGQIIFEFINNGLPIESEKLEALNKNLTSYEPEFYDGKIGLRNVYTRLSYFYGDSLKMQVVNNDQAGVSIQIFISEK